MPVNPSDKITQAALQPLADLANDKLLPLVQAAVTAGQFQPHVYSVRADDGSLLNPPPVYAFPATALLPVPVVTGSVHDGDGDYFPTAAIWVFPYKIVAGEKIYSPAPGRLQLSLDNFSTILWEWNAIPGADGYLLKLLNGNDFFGGNPSYKDVATNSYLDNGDGQNPFNPMSWLYQLNRIRADYWNILFGLGGGADLFTPNFLASGPWIVGVNDSAAYPLFDNGGFFNAYTDFSTDTDYQLWITTHFSMAGILLGTMNGRTETVFKNVKFICANSAAGAAVKTARYLNFYPHTGNHAANHLDLDYTASIAGHWKCLVRWPITGPANAVPNPAIFNPTVAAGVTWRCYQETIPKNPNVKPGQFYWIEAAIDLTLAAVSGSLSLSVTSAPNYEFLADGQDQCFASVNSIFEISSANASVAQTVIHPGESGIAIAGNDLPDHSDFIINGSSAWAAWILSDTTIQGCWQASTLPVPALNVFLDAAMPPYIGNAQSGTAIAGNGLTGLNRPSVSGLRESAPVELNDTGNQLVPADAKINPDLVGIAARQSRWMVLRDTDAEIFQWGFGFGDNVSELTGDLTGKNRTDPPFRFFVLAGATKISVRAYQGGSAKSQNGIIQAGSPPAQPLTLKLWNGTDPNTQPPAATGINEIDFVPALTNVISQVTAENPAAGDDQFTSYDLVVIVHGSARWPYFFPKAALESFSFCYDGSPFLGQQGSAAADGKKAVPQNGHCLFKVQCKTNTNAVVAADLPVKIGQRINGVFTEIITVTIPAGKNISPPQAVFWPVLAGQELRYQCAEEIQVLAFAHWQPAFFSTYYGRYLYLGTFTNTSFVNGGSFHSFNSGYPDIVSTDHQPILNQYALAFSNRFNPANANYPAGGIVTKTQFPMAAGNYNDLEAALNLLS